MTIVQVDKQIRGRWAEGAETQSQVHVDIPGGDEPPSDAIRKAAFRFVNRRKEIDYSEMANHTLIISVIPVSMDQFNLMFTHIN